jgi:hypothetical protein
MTHQNTVEGGPDAQELHRDLARKLRNVGSKVGTIWRKFTPKQRETAMRGAVGDGKVLQHSRDLGLGGVVDHIPEYNLRDMTSRPEHFLDIWEFRALTPLPDQLYKGARNMPGDRELIGMSAAFYSQDSRGERTFFKEGWLYGRSIERDAALVEQYPDVLGDDHPLIIPSAIGQRILQRQQNLLQYLNHIVEETLKLGSETRITKAPEKNANEAAINAVANLQIRPKPLQTSLPDLTAQAKESKAALEDSFHLLRTEPVVLDQAVNTAFMSRVELVPDGQGRVLSAMTDRYLTTAFFDSVSTAVRAIAIWDYIVRLLQLLAESSEKVKQNIVLQELSNTLHLGYRRAQECFKRRAAVHIARKRFKRITDCPGAPKIVMKGQPADCTVSNPQLHYILRLCHSDTSPSDAVDWIRKLDDHNKRYTDDREKLSEAEMAALDELVMIVSFMHMTSTAVRMAPVSFKSGTRFTARLAEVDMVLNSIQRRADFGDYLIPMHNLLEPQMASSALTALDDFVLRETEMRLGSLFEDVLDKSLIELEVMHDYANYKLRNAGTTTYIPLPQKSSPSSDTERPRPRTKTKTRSPDSSVYSITIPPEAPQIVTTEPTQFFQVKYTTASLFTTLFSRSEARGSVAWTDFDSAMADLQFSVTPRGGSRIAFNPPDSIEGGPATIHRPHGSDIEGYMLLNIARTLQRVYEWTSKSFVVT